MRPGDGLTVPLVLCIDVEPDGDGEAPVPGGPWAGTLSIHAWLSEVRAQLEERTQAPARLSWFLRMDPQVEEVYGSATHAVEAHADLVADVAAHEDAVGLHVHPWRQTEDGWLDDYADAHWFGECIDQAFAAFSLAFGRPCRLTRIGSRYLDAPTVQRLVDHGVTVDLTAEPGQVDRPDRTIPHLRGTLPDYRRTPRRPHALAPGIVELPLTAGRKSLGLRPYAHLSRMRRHGLRERLDQPLPFGMRAHGPHSFGEQVRRSLAMQARPYLAFAIRTGSMLDDAVAARLRSHMDELLALPEAHRFRAVTPEAAVAELA